MTDTALVLAWVVFAHLVADFVLQNDWIAINKGTGGRLGWTTLLLHGFHVALCLVPFVLAFGLRGLAYLVIVAGSHIVVDRWKVLATRRAEATAQAAARLRIERTGAAPTSGLGAAWTPWPGILFLADQALHMTFAIVGWLVILEGAALLPQFIDFADAVLRDWDRAAVHATILTGVVLVSLFIVNTRGAYYFILALVTPRELAPAPVTGPTGVPSTSRGYTVRMGPLVATVEPGVSAPSAVSATAGRPAAGVPLGGPLPSGAAVAAAPLAPLDPPPAEATPTPAEGTVEIAPTAVPGGAPARIGATIGALERLLIVAFILTGAEVAIGFVIAAKTIARYKQLDDRGFAEYYLLGTLASVSVALLTGIVAQAALRTLG